MCGKPAEASQSPLPKIIKTNKNKPTKYDTHTMQLSTITFCYMYFHSISNSEDLSKELPKHICKIHM